MARALFLRDTTENGHGAVGEDPMILSCTLIPSSLRFAFTRYEDYELLLILYGIAVSTHPCFSIHHPWRSCTQES